MNPPPHPSTLAATLRALGRRAFARLMSGGPRVDVGGYLVILALALALQAWPQFQYLDAKVYDHSLRLLRQFAPRPIAPDVAIVAADEASFEAFDEPLALWHRRLGQLVDAMGTARASVLGLDIILPARSFEAMAPGLDRELMGPLLAARGRLPVVLGQSLDAEMRPRPIFPGFARFVGEAGIGSAVLCMDDDGVVRRTFGDLCGTRTAGGGLAERMAARLGIAPHAAGLIDYRVGTGFTVVSLVQVLRWHESGDETRLRAAFEGRPVLVGLVLPLEDRLRASTPLFADEASNTRVPGVMLHAQILRTLLTPDRLRSLPGWGTAALTAAVCLLWFGYGWRKTLLYWTLFPLLALLGLAGLWLGYAMSQASLLVAAQLAYSARQALEARRFAHQRSQITRAFAGHVSPALLRRVQAEDAAGAGSQVDAQVREAAVLQIDLQLGETDTLDRLALPFELIRRAVQEHGGMLDRLQGRHATAFFGVPLPMPQPARAALAAVQALRTALQAQRVAAAASGAPLPPLALGIAVGAVRTGFVALEGARPYVVLGGCIEEAEDLARGASLQGHAYVVAWLSPEAARRAGQADEPARFAPVLGGTAYTLNPE